MQEWSDIVKLAVNCKNVVKIALVGKYFKNQLMTNENQIFRDSYASVINALNDAGLHSNCKIEAVFVWAEDLEAASSIKKQAAAMKLLEEAHGIVITACFNVPGFEGMMQACKYGRESKKPLLSICYGMQCAIIEFAQNVCKIKGAWSTKLWDEQNDKCNNQLQPLKPEQKVIIKMFERFGEKSEMRLGRRTTTFITENSKVFNDYGRRDSIQERHRHGYEVNPEFVPRLIAAGLRFVGIGVDEGINDETENFPETSQKMLGIAPNKEMSYLEKVNTLCQYSTATKTAVRMEIMELENHPYFVGIQFHPEFQSRPFSPSPPFLGLIRASLQYSKIL
uniref:CTP synthase (glutamine hydrolyzing) n=1 Tax=Panagrolaimus davidi TaxID=227884 RepID=A0A914QKY6_9BILA